MIGLIIFSKTHKNFQNTLKTLKKQQNLIIIKSCHGFTDLD